jgi:hypothetical protein
LRNAYIAGLDLERRTIEVYDADGTHVDDILSMSSNPAIATWNCQLKLEEPTLRELADRAIYWNTSHDGATLEISSAAITEVDGHALVAWAGGERVTVSVDGMDVEDVEGAGVMLFGNGSTRAALTDLVISGVVYSGVSVTGVGHLRLSDITVIDANSRGIELDTISDLTAAAMRVAQTRKEGVSLREIDGVVYETSVSGAEGGGIDVTRSEIALVDGSVNSSPTGLTCDSSSTVSPCSGFAFDGVAVELDGCPTSCAE